MKQLWVLAPLVLAAACGSAPQLTASEEYYAGRAVVVEILLEARPVDDEDLQIYVNQVGMNIALSSERPELFNGWTFIVIDSEGINAVSASGGIILVTKGFLRVLNTEDELAAVLAHEIAHVCLRHPELALNRAVEARNGFDMIQDARDYGTAGLEAAAFGLSLFGKNRAARGVRSAARGARIVANLSGLLDDVVKDMIESIYVKGYEREQEYEADLRGMDYLADPDVGYDPSAMADVLQRLVELGLTADSGGFFNKSTHPEPAQRVENARNYMREKSYSGATEQVRTDRFLERKNRLK